MRQARATRQFSWYPLGLLMVVYAIDQSDRFLLSALFPLLKEEFRLSDTELGSLSAAFALIAGVAAIPLGTLADRWHRVRIIALGMLFWAVGMVATGLAGSFATLFLFRMMLGFGESSYEPASFSLLNDYYPVAKRGMVQGLIRTGSLLGFTTLPLGGLVAETWNWRTAFHMYAVVGFVLAVLAWRLPEPLRGLRDLEHRGITGVASTGSKLAPVSFRAAARRIFSVPTAALALSGQGVTTFFMAGIGIWFTTFLVRYHDMSLTRAAGSVSLIALSAAVGTLGGGVVGDRLVRRGIDAGRAYMLGGSYVLCCVAWFVGLAVDVTSLMLLLFMVGAMALASGFPNVAALRADVIHPELRGRIAGLSVITNTAGGALSPLLFGLLSDSMGLRSAFMVTIPLMGLVGVLTLVLAPRFVVADTLAMQQELVRDLPDGAAVALRAADVERSAATMASPGLALRNLHAGYGAVRVLHDVTISVPQGELVSLLGPNGAGKSTLQRSIAGLTTVTAGAIVHDEEDITGWSAHDVARRGICYIPEGRAVFRSMTVLENMAMFAGGPVGVDDRERVYEVFPVLKDRGSQLAGTLSGGQQQMLALTRTMLRPNRILLLDELSFGLSPALIDELFLVVEQLKGLGMGILLVEQYADRALAVADTVYVLNKGSIVFAGEPCELPDAADVMALYSGHPAPAVVPR